MRPILPGWFLATSLIGAASAQPADPFRSVLPDSAPAQQASPSHPGVPEPMPDAFTCDSESTQSSHPGGRSVIVRFENKTNASVKLWWINSRGVRVLYREIPKGADAAQKTFATHPWVVTDGAEKCIATYIATDAPTQSFKIQKR
jgi:VHL beta domain